MLGNIIGGFVVILVGTTLAPTVANSVQASLITNGSGLVYNNPNFTNSSGTILSLSTLFYNLAVAATAIGISTQGLKNAGLM